MKRLLIELTDEEYNGFLDETSYIEYIDTIQEKLKYGADIDEKKVKMYLVSAFGFVKSYEPVLIFFDLEKAQEYVDQMEFHNHGRDYKIDEIDTGDYKVELPEIHRYCVCFTENTITVDEEDVPEGFADKNWTAITGDKDMIQVRLYDNDRPSAIKKAKSILKDMNKKFLSTDE